MGEAKGRGGSEGQKKRSVHVHESFNMNCQLSFREHNAPSASPTVRYNIEQVNIFEDRAILRQVPINNKQLFHAFINVLWYCSVHGLPSCLHVDILLISFNLKSNMTPFCKR